MCTGGAATERLLREPESRPSATSPATNGTGLRAVSGVANGAESQDDRNS